jgi:hypothetical protein
LVKLWNNQQSTIETSISSQNAAGEAGFYKARQAAGRPPLEDFRFSRGLEAATSKMLTGRPT